MEVNNITMEKIKKSLKMSTSDPVPRVAQIELLMAYCRKVCLLCVIVNAGKEESNQSSVQS